MRWAFRPVDGTRPGGSDGRHRDPPRLPRPGIFRRSRWPLSISAREDTDLIFNTPNADSRPGYLKMGWQRGGRRADRPSRPVRPLRLARRRSRRVSAPRPTRGSLRAAATGCPRSPRCSTTCATTSPGCSPTGRARPDSARLSPPQPRLPALALRDSPGSRLPRGPVVRDGDGWSGLGIGRVRPRGGLAELTLAEVLIGRGDRRPPAACCGPPRRAGVDHVADPPAQLDRVTRRPCAVRVT